MITPSSQRLRWFFMVSVGLFLAVISQPVWAINANPKAFFETQPDGSQVQLRAPGDEHFNWTEDANGYAVVQHQGWYKYAQLDGNGRLTAPGVAYNQVDLNWTDQATDETGFEIERALDGTGNWSLAGTSGVNDTTFSDTSVSPLTAYDYRVRAMKGGTESAYSNVLDVSTPDAPPVSINLTANGYKVKGEHTIDLSWSGNSGAVDIYRNGGSPIASGVAGSSYTDNTGNKGAATYQFQVCEDPAKIVCFNVDRGLLKSHKSAKKIRPPPGGL